MHRELDELSLSTHALVRERLEVGDAIGSHGVDYVLVVGVPFLLL